MERATSESPDSAAVTRGAGPAADCHGPACVTRLPTNRPGGQGRGEGRVELRTGARGAAKLSAARFSVGWVGTWDKRGRDGLDPSPGGGLGPADTSPSQAHAARDSVNEG